MEEAMAIHQRLFHRLLATGYRRNRRCPFDGSRFQSEHGSGAYWTQKRSHHIQFIPTNAHQRVDEAQSSGMGRRSPSHDEHNRQRFHPSESFRKLCSIEDGWKLHLVCGRLQFHVSRGGCHRIRGRRSDDRRLVAQPGDLHEEARLPRGSMATRHSTPAQSCNLQKNILISFIKLI